MRFKYPLLLCVIVLCLSWIPISHAQNDVWRAWLYDDSEGRMLLINSEQQVLDNFILPKPSGFESYSYPYFVSVAPTGDHVAYTLTGLDQSRVFVIYHLFNRNIVTQYTIGAPALGAYSGVSLDYLGRPEMFSDDGRFFALSYFFNDSWALLLFDTLTGTLTQSLTSNMVGLPTQSTMLTPVPVYVDFGTVNVVFAPVASGGFFTLDHYRWDYVSNAFTQSNVFRGLTYDIEPRTGEVIYPYLDPQFPDRTDEIIGMGVHQNTIQVYSPSVLDAPFPFYSDADNVINRATFMQNGERVLVDTYPLASEGNNGVYVVANRSGTMQGVLPYQGVSLSNAFGVRDGVVFNIATVQLAPYMPFVQGMDTYAVVFVDTVNYPVGTNTGVVLYLGDEGKYPRLVWVRDTVTSNPPSPNAWAMLTPPIANNPSNNPQQPSINPTPSSGIFVGGQGRVTNQVQYLNMRLNPTTSAEILTQLAPFTVVPVVGGPQYAQGYTWWMVTYGELIGWVAAGTGDQVWLEPYSGAALPPPPAPVVSTPTSLPAPILYEPEPFAVFTLAQLNPPGSGTIISIAFEWEVLVGAESYFLQIQRCNDTGDNCQNIYGGYFYYPSFFFDITQFGYGTYRWRAFAVDFQGNQGASSDWSYFRYQMN
jgi:hypothetical protein